MTWMFAYPFAAQLPVQNINSLEFSYRN